MQRKKNTAKVEREFMPFVSTVESRDSAVDTQTRLAGPGSSPGKGKTLISSDQTSRAALLPTQTSIQWVPSFFSKG